MKCEVEGEPNLQSDIFRSPTQPRASERFTSAKHPRVEAARKWSIYRCKRGNVQMWRRCTILLELRRCISRLLDGTSRGGKLVAGGRLQLSRSRRSSSIDFLWQWDRPRLPRSRNLCGNGLGPDCHKLPPAQGGCVHQNESSCLYTVGS